MKEVILFRPREQQLAIHRALKQARFGVVVCHRRMGKTVLAVNELIRGAMTCPKPNGRFAYLAPTYTQGKAIAFDYFRRFSDEVEGRKVNQSELRIDFANGGQVRIYGADNPDSLRGLYFDGVVLDEFGLHPARTFSEVVSPTLVDRGGWALFMGTPNGRNQFWDIAQHAKAREAEGDSQWFFREYKASQTGLLDAAMLAQARSTMTSDEFAQEFECFPAGTLIATAYGHRAIDQIREQDPVLTHRGRWRPVTRTMSRQYHGDLCLIHAFGALSQPLRCTPEHPVATYDRSTQATLWKPAAEVAEGDYLLLPRSNGASVPMLSGAWASLIGWFIGEGSVNGNAVTFSLNPNRPEEATAVMGYLKAIGAPASQYDAGRVTSCSVMLADTLVSLCGSLAENKRIPFAVIAGREAEVFDALMLADGCSVEPVQGGHRWSYTTVSRGLAYDVQFLSAMLGRRAGIVPRPGASMVSPTNGVTYQSLPSYSVQIPKGTKVNHSKARDAHPCTRGVAYRVKSVSRVPFDGEVFNLSVKEDESYVAEGRAVHNCSFEAAVKGAIYGRELEAARADGRVTAVPYDPALPVDTDWDLGIGDAMAIWFSQSTRGGEVRLIDYHEASGEGFPYYVQVLRGKGYTYGQHWAPHDIQVRELSSGRSRLEVAAQQGIRFEVTPRLQSTEAGEVEEGIHAARMLFPRCWFDAVKCRAGLEALMHYRRDYNERLGEFKATPVHDNASHGSDAFRGLAVRHQIPKEKAKARMAEMPRTWQWS